MRTRYWLTIAASLSLTSCEQCPPCEQADSAAPPGASTEASTLAPADADRAAVITPGIYTVCHDAGESGHGALVGAHLAEKELFEIRPINADGPTKVCLKKACPAVGSDQPQSDVKIVWMGGDERKLGGEATFDHKKGGQTVQVPHFVEIFNNPNDHGDSEKCKSNNALTINFCIKSDSGEYNCVGGAGPHFGHVHGED